MRKEVRRCAGEADSSVSLEKRGDDGVVITIYRLQVDQGRGCLKNSHGKEDRDHEA